MTIDRLRRWLPWPIVLVVVGMLVRAYSAPGALAPFTLDPRVIGYFLPALIFEAAWDFELPLLARTARSIGVLAVPGVLVTTLIVALGARLSGTLAWSSALVLGAIVSATDPIAVLALFRRLRLPPALVAIVEGESIANDGVAVVLTQTLVVCALGGTALGWTYPLLRMLAVSLGGIAVGVGMGFIVAVFLRSALAGGAQVILTLVLGYGSYVIAQALGFSGIFATVAAGLVAAAGGGYRGHEDPRRLYVAHYWDVAALAANVIVFILLGMNLSLEWLSRAPLLCAAAIAATFLARALLAYVLVPLRGLGESTRGWRNAIALAGLRGGLSVALALGLPLVLPGRDAILYATVAVVFTTLVVQGILTPHLVPRLAIADSD